MLKAIIVSLAVSLVPGMALAQTTGSAGTEPSATRPAVSPATLPVDSIAPPSTLTPAISAVPAATAPGIASVLISREDLAACKLPHGEVLVPVPSSPEGANGYLLRFSDARLGVFPKVEVGKTNHDLVDKMRQEKTGDLFFSTKGEGTLIVISGKVADLGHVYLFGLSDIDLPAPKETAADAADPRQISGTVPAAQEGNVYIVETVEDNYALVRVLRKQANGVLVQYVYQPNGSTRFAIPRGMTIALPAGPLVKPVQALTPTNLATTQHAPTTLTPTTAPDPRDHLLEPFLSAHLLQRQMLIERRIAIVRSTPRTDAEIATKADAIEELGKLRATEAIDPLLDEISFLNPRARIKRFSVEAYHPAVQALREIGKPASLAALKAIRNLKPEVTPGRPDPLLTVEYRLRLLTLVITGVEGPDVAEFLLRQDLAKADDATKPLYEQALKYLREP